MRMAVNLMYEPRPAASAGMLSFLAAEYLLSSTVQL